MNLNHSSRVLWLRSLQLSQTLQTHIYKKYFPFETFICNAFPRLSNDFCCCPCCREVGLPACWVPRYAKGRTERWTNPPSAPSSCCEAVPAGSANIRPETNHRNPRPQKPPGIEIPGTRFERQNPLHLGPCIISICDTCRILNCM